jgi:DNA-binding MarR family transcriptional regulator
MYGIEDSLSRCTWPKYLAVVAADADPVDELLAQWRRERPDLAEDLPAMGTIGRLGRFVALAGRSIDDVFAAHGISTGEFDVLAALRRAGAPHVMTPTALTRTLMLSPAGMTNRLDRLEAAGHIERRADPDDRRSLLVVLTRQGRELVDAAVTDHVANEARLLGALSPRQRSTLDGLLRALLRPLG